jgi:hypothetical protein
LPSHTHTRTHYPLHLLINGPKFLQCLREAAYSHSTRHQILFPKDEREITEQSASRTHVEDEVLVGVLEGEPAAEVDAPDQHRDRRDDGQRVRHVGERRRSHAQHHGLPVLSLVPSPPTAAAAGYDGMSGENVEA